jgi:hypothetical protein
MKYILSVMICSLRRDIPTHGSCPENAWLLTVEVQECDESEQAPAVPSVLQWVAHRNRHQSQRMPYSTQLQSRRRSQLVDPHLSIQPPVGPPPPSAPQKFHLSRPDALNHYAGLRELLRHHGDALIEKIDSGIGMR